MTLADYRYKIHLMAMVSYAWVAATVFYGIAFLQPLISKIYVLSQRFFSRTETVAGGKTFKEW